MADLPDLTSIFERVTGRKPTNIDGIIDSAAHEQELNPNLVREVVKAESDYNPRSVSPKGAQGLMQLMPKTAASYGVTDPFDPQQNINAGVRHLKYLHAKYGGDIPKTLAAYNAGEEPVDKAGGVPDIPETQAYVKKITGAYQPDASEIFRRVTGRSPAKLKDLGSRPTLAEIQALHARNMAEANPSVGEMANALVESATSGLARGVSNLPGAIYTVLKGGHKFFTGDPSVFSDVYEGAKGMIQQAGTDIGNVSAVLPGALGGQGGEMPRSQFEKAGAAVGENVGAAAGPLLAGAALGAVGKVFPKATGKIFSFPSPELPIGDVIPAHIKKPLFQAIKPSKSSYQFEKHLDLSIPELAKASETAGERIAADGTKTIVPPIANDSLNGLADNIVKAKKALIGPGSQYEALLSPNATVVVDTTPIANAMVNKITSRFRLQNPEAAAKIESTAGTYRRKMTLGEMEDFLQDANNELSTYYAKTFSRKADAARDPATGHVVAEADGLRKMLYAKLDELTGANARLIKAKWGALDNLQQEVANRQVTFARQSPQNLSQQLSWWHGLGTAAAGVGQLNPMKVVGGLAQPLVAKYVKGLNNPDYLIKKSFDRYLKHASRQITKEIFPPMPPPPPSLQPTSGNQP